MKTALKTTLAFAISLPLLTGCVTPGEDDPNQMTKTGAAGGALLGLTLGALTGDPELAVKGAVAGGVAGGVAGAGADIQNNRDGMRSSSRDDAIASIGNGNDNGSSNSAPKTWDELNNFTGEWDVSIRNHTGEQTGTRALHGLGTLPKTTQADVRISNDQGVDITAEFSYTPETGYEVNLVNAATDVEIGFAGEFLPQANRYQFYPTDVNKVIYQGVETADIRIELGFAGSSVWFIDTFAFVGGSEQKVQTFRFTAAN